MPRLTAHSASLKQRATFTRSLTHSLSQPERRGEHSTRWRCLAMFSSVGSLAAAAVLLTRARRALRLLFACYLALSEFRAVEWNRTEGFACDLAALFSLCVASMRLPELFPGP